MASHQLSDSCLHSIMDVRQIRDGPFNLWGRVGFFKYLFAILVWKHVCVCVRTAIYAPELTANACPQWTLFLVPLFAIHMYFSYQFCDDKYQPGIRACHR